MEVQTVHSEINNGNAKITLNRPKAPNCFNEMMHEEPRTALERAKNEAEARVLVFTGTGRAFSSGQDLEVHAETMKKGQPLRSKAEPRS